MMPLSEMSGLGGLSASSYTEERREEMPERTNQLSRTSLSTVYVPDTEDSKMEESATSLNIEDLQKQPKAYYRFLFLPAFRKIKSNIFFVEQFSVRLFGQNTDIEL
jgi:hypothetical protein